MTTTIRSASTPMARSLIIADQDDMADTVLIECVHRGAMEGGTRVKRAEFLAAVATELDVLVIPRTDLPEVKPLPKLSGATVGDVPYSLNVSAGERRKDAFAALALAEYLDAHPPIDQAQVDTLATLLRDTGARPNGADTIPIARRLIATGRVTVKGAEA